MDGFHVLIAGAHGIIRYGLKGLIEEHIPGCVITEAENYDILLRSLQEGDFTHLLLDLQLYAGDMLEKFSAIRKDYPALYIMAYSAFNEVAYAKLLISIGANGFLSKDSSQAEIIFALQQFINHNFYVSSKVVRPQFFTEIDKEESNNNLFSSLSPREMQMTSLLLKGDTAKQIQNVLHLKSSTVSTLKTRIFEKLRVSNIIELIKLAEAHHII
jgi:two-component system invasion response regulator UvrY